MQTARKICYARGPIDKKTLHYIRSELFTARICFVISGDFAVSEVLYQLRAKKTTTKKKLLRHKRHYIIFDFAISGNFFVTQRNFFAGTKNSLRYIRHLVLSDFVISGFECIWGFIVFRFYKKRACLIVFKVSVLAVSAWL